MTASFALFDTEIGVCGLAWTAHGVSRVALPEADPAGMRRRLSKDAPQGRESAPPPEVQAVIDAIVTLLRGEAVDLSRVALDLTGVAEFDRSVYAVARTVPAGETTTYGEIAARLGGRSLARDVGQALGRNPCPIIVPCHRVLAAGGKAGGFSARGGLTTKMRLLSIECARTSALPGLFDGLPLSVRP